MAQLPSSFSNGDVLPASSANQWTNERDGHFLPISPTTKNYITDAYDIGSDTYKWRNGYFSGDIDISGSCSVGSDMSIGGKFSTGGETAPDVDDGGICINHNDGDGFAFTIKNSDISHESTGFIETDTYFAIDKLSDSDGGARLFGLGEASIGIELNARSDTEDTSTANTSDGKINLNALDWSGVAWGTCGNTSNILSIQNNGVSKFLVKGNGDTYVEETKRVACGGGSTGAGTTANGTVTLEINGTSYYLLASASA